MKVILNILTHGDERAGVVIAKEIKKLKLLKGQVLIHIANKLAYKKRKRFIDQDLNRSFPGKLKGNHEERLAAKILPLVKSADIVIDIHTTRSELRDALIVTKLSKKTKQYINVIRPKYLLQMNATKNNALISNARVGVAFEYGKDKDKRTIRNTVIGIKRLLSHLGMIRGKLTKSKNKTKWFVVYRSVPKPKKARLLANTKNYKLVKKGMPYAVRGDKKILAKTDFYPILFGKNSYKEIFGFAARLLKSSK